MLALYRCGRHARALEAFQTFRRMLNDELGIDPPRLKEVERLILRQDASLDHDSHEQLIGEDLDGSVAVATLGRPGTEAAGRERELIRLERLHAEAQTGARRFAFVTGDAGIGKTTIVESFVARVGSAAAALVAHGQCVEHRGAGDPTCPCWPHSADSLASRAGGRSSHCSLGRRRRGSHRCRGSSPTTSSRPSTAA